ncbi:WD40-like Beta Propeller Repeat [Micromonospora viridifaciens]|uniref:WD40-like Beta Propeller Repeat n=1 Tax=Micromonospora viridifaciens TaxID=1881 RepID=A0A1C5A1M2_MICVI|nr:PD40 domain-containing protein [Micromonospora viridifaciens]SCF39152.1 WD40-like Beta Propeller Repeat [Micromonospora viridifaciens]
MLVALAGVALPLARTPVVDPAAGADAALPNRVGVPPFGSLHATDWPRLGPASVIFTGQAPGLVHGEEGSIIAVIGADADRYRIIKGEIEAQAGGDAVLSPDGRRIAFRSPGLTLRVEIVDLVTGRSRTVSSGVSDTLLTAPAGWSPDGRALVIGDAVPANPERSAYRNVLSIVWPDGDRRIRLADEHEGIAPVAFAPDGARLAFQVGRTVTVTDLDGRRLSSFTLAPEAELAGKGAWSTDGRTLTVTRRDGGSWSLRRADPATGRDLGAVDTPTASGVTAIRLLGWAADGSARVVAYQPAPHAPAAFDAPLEMDQRLAYGNVGTVRVLALGRGSQSPTTLLTAPTDVVSIDVSDDVIHGGRTRDASPPHGLGPRFWYWTLLVTFLVAGIAAYRNREGLALWLHNRRARRARRGDVTGGPLAN